MITVEVTWPNISSKFFISVIYASNDSEEREGLWSEITNLASSHSLHLKPWLLLGDFNQIRAPSEHSLPISLNMDKRARDFNQCLSDANLEDLNFRGPTFTWWNKQKRAPVAKKLDRGLSNDEWYSLFPSSIVLFGSTHFSDHVVIAISLDPARIKSKKPFRFFNFLAKNPNFLNIIAYNWFSFNVTGSAMFRVSRKLKLLKNIIRDFSRQNYSEIEKRTAEAHDELLYAQSSMLTSLSTSNAALEISAQRRWEELSTAEAGFFFQKSCIQWLSFGDGNSRLFHRYAASMQAKNHIHYLISDTGQRVESQLGMQDLCVSYFSDLLGSPIAPPVFIQSDLDLLFNFRCSAEQAAGFEKEFTPRDIRDAFFTLPKNKTCGPDGYSAEFFTASWSVIGPEVTEAVLEFFRSGSLLKQWNSAILVLIPKKQNASLTTDFRPISCLNTVYKVISKLLAMRLKEIPPQIISSAQSAFLPGRLLAENVLLATDLVNGYNTQAVSSRGMLKVDLRKAFDSVRWDFILATLRAIAVPESYISLISECLSTASFTIAVNGIAGGFFKSSKGIRQGDPLSPYLFVLAMEGLSRLLLARYESESIGFHPNTNSLKISHLMFADDVMIFFDGTANSLHGISECLDDFASWSGLHMNPSKTELFTSGLELSESAAIAAYAFPVGQLPIRYLGLPLMSRKLKISEYSPLMLKLTARFQAWSAKALSFPGRLQLLKTVIFGTVNFWISAFILPKGCIKSIEALSARFLWSGSLDKRGIAKMSWKTVCLPKEEGGLGLRSLVVWNQVLCLRFIWRLLSKAKSLWVEWHWDSHLQNKCFWTIEPSATHSWMWKRLLKLRPLALQLCRSVLGNGDSTSFWFDVWTPFGQLISHIGPNGPRALRMQSNAMVSEAIGSAGTTCSLPHPRSQQQLELHTFLTTVSLPLQHEAEDMVQWVAGDSPSREFSSASTWEVIRPREAAKDWIDVVWFKGAIPKLAFTMWVANGDRLPTLSRLAGWNIPVCTSCVLCSSSVETRDHLFITCQYSLSVWKEVLLRCRSPARLFTNWSELLSWIRVSPSRKVTLLRKLACQLVVFHL